MAKNKIKVYENDAYVTMEHCFPSGMYMVKIVSPQGNHHDKILCDTYGAAMDYWRSFNKVAKNLWK